MLLPNVASAVRMFEQSVILREVFRTQDDDGEDVETNVDTFVSASIQVARAEELLIDKLDRSVQYLKVHARFTFDIAERMSNANVNFYILYKNKSFRIVQVSDWIDYGYSRCYAAEDKRAINN